MNSLQLRYNLLHIFYFFSICSINGFTAVFLQNKGMSNTLVGLAMGIGSVLSIAIAPVFSSVLENIKGITIKKLILIVYSVQFAVYLAMAFLNLPVFVILPAYMVMMSSVIAVTPLLSMICMNYASKGYDIDFGTARGLGSLSYAIGAVLLGQISKIWTPDYLALAFLASGLCMFLVLFSMPDSDIQVMDEKNPDSKKKDRSSIFYVIKTYKVFFLFLLGFGIVYAGVSALGTYLVNIVTSLGGDTSLYGIALFCMAASELPVMAATGNLIKRFGSERLIAIAAVFYLFRNFTICLAPSIPILLIGMMCQGASYGLFTAVITNYVGSHLPERHGLAGQNLISIMSTGLGTSSGSILGGVLIDVFGFTGLKLFALALTVIGCFIMLAAAFHVLSRERAAKTYVSMVNAKAQKA